MTKKKVKKTLSKSVKPMPHFQRLDDEMNYALLQRRIVKMNDGINNMYSGYLMHQLYYLANQSNEPIHIIINSPGGYVYDGFFLYNTIKDIVEGGIEVITEVRGLCASMATIILQAGSKRVARRTAKIMMHEVGSAAVGKASEMEEEIKEIRKVNDQLRDIIAKKTGHSKESIDKMWSKKDVYFSAEEALKFRLIDEILD